MAGHPFDDLLIMSYNDFPSFRPPLGTLKPEAGQLLFTADHKSLARHSFAKMVRASEIKDSIAQHDEGLFVLAREDARQGSVARFDYDPFPRPLPELRLRSPELLAITTDNQRSALLLLCLSHA